MSVLVYVMARSSFSASLDDSGTVLPFFLFFLEQVWNHDRTASCIVEDTLTHFCVVSFSGRMTTSVFHLSFCGAIGRAGWSQSHNKMV